MGITKTIVVLANSRKCSGRYIAGKIVAKKGCATWIRPISDRSTAELSREERCYADGEDPQLLDIASIHFQGKRPLHHQTENHLIDAEYYWTKKGELPAERLDDFIDQIDTLWINNESSRFGLNDRVNRQSAYKILSSLIFIKVKSLIIRVQPEFGRKVRADFNYRKIHYIFSITDPIIKDIYLSQPDGQYRLNNVYLCISLGEAFTDGFCYKLVAAVIKRGRNE